MLGNFFFLLLLSTDFFQNKLFQNTFRVSNGLDLDQAPGYKTFFSILNSAEHGIYPARNVKMPPIAGILTFISMVNTTSERLKARHFFICRYLSANEELKFRAQLS